jgi:hypothetical protein
MWLPLRAAPPVAAASVAAAPVVAAPLVMAIGNHVTNIFFHTSITEVTDTLFC